MDMGVPNLTLKLPDVAPTTAKHRGSVVRSSRQPEAHALAHLRSALSHKVDDLNAQRSQLVLKELHGSLTPAEHSRLDYLTWQLEQYDEAVFGDHWSLIRAAIEQRVTLAREMQDFIADLKAVLMP